MSTTRRELLRSVAAFGGAFVLSRGLAACVGQSGGDVSASDDALDGCEAPVISANHGHTLVVSANDIALGVEKTYAIQGSSGHPHSVTLTAEHFAALAAGTSVTVVSTRDAGHTHSVTLRCASTAGQDGGAGGADAGVLVCASSRISANHGHTFVLPGADLSSTTTKTYSIQGSSGHPHTIALGPSEFAALRANRTVSVTSSTDAGHSHVVDVVCA